MTPELHRHTLCGCTPFAGAASRQVVEEKTFACIREAVYADADSSCRGASLSPSMTVSEQARITSRPR
jgi:hypothetical protein